MSRISKLHESIVSSSIWGEGDATRIVWVTMLAIKDRRGKVSASVTGLAHQARVSVVDCEAALAKFLAPDPDSRSKNDEGRRIRVVDGGWEIINHRKYSQARDEDQRKEQNRLAQKRRRGKKPTPETTSVAPTPSPALTPKKISHRQPPSAAVSHEPEFTLEMSAACQQPSANGHRESAKRLPTTEPAKRIAALFSRRLTTPWSPEEVVKFREIGEINLADLDLIEAYYAKERAKGDGDNGGRHRRDLGTFLNNFLGELDRARSASLKSKGPNNEDPAGWREWLAEKRLEFKPYRFAQEIERTQFLKRNGKSES